MIIKGTIVHGRGVGKTFGFPTANINTNEKIQITPGVYSAVIELKNHRYPAVVNIGSCPTFSVNKETIEAHIIGFDGDIYEEKVTLIINKKLRDIMKFENIEALKNQIKCDIDNCLKQLD